MIALTKDQREKMIKKIIGEDFHIQNIEILNPNGTYFTVGQVMPVYMSQDAILYCIDISDNDLCMHEIEDLIIDGVSFNFLGGVL